MVLELGWWTGMGLIVVSIVCPELGIPGMVIGVLVSETCAFLGCMSED